MTKSSSIQQLAWTNHWLASVVSGGSKMSSRNVRSIEKRGGGLRSVVKLAKRQGVHLVLLEDDKGNQLVAASVNRFKVLA